MCIEVYSLYLHKARDRYLLFLVHSVAYCPSITTYSTELRQPPCSFRSSVFPLQMSYYALEPQVFYLNAFRFCVECQAKHKLRIDAAKATHMTVRFHCRRMKGKKLIETSWGEGERNRRHRHAIPRAKHESVWFNRISRVGEQAVPVRLIHSVNRGARERSLFPFRTRCWIPRSISYCQRWATVDDAHALAGPMSSNKSKK